MRETFDDAIVRLEKLEIKASFQEDLIASLSIELNDERMRVQRMERTVAALAEKIKELTGEEIQIMPANERPPHY